MRCAYQNKNNSSSIPDSLKIENAIEMKTKELSDTQILENFIK